MPDTLVTDLRHYLDDRGQLPEMPGPALNLALFQGAIVEWITVRPTIGLEKTNVYCRRKPRVSRCMGAIIARIEGLDRAIAWQCDKCGDNGVIRGWQNTIWDRRELDRGEEEPA
jgi:hypothetical protein